MSLREYEVDVLGLTARCWRGGSGFPVLLLHGSGPGAASLGTWSKVFAPLMARYEVVATDLIGFGLSQRKLSGPFFDLDLWLAQASAVLAEIAGSAVGVIGHSLSGAIALRLAAVEPRITKLMTTGTMGGAFRAIGHTSTAWTFPETREELRAALEVITYDHSGITDTLLDQRMAILHDGVYGPYFKAMFGGDKQRFVDAAALTDAELGRIACDVLLVHGLNDRIIPFAENSVALAGRLARGDALLLGRCGHLPALEQPEKLVAAATGFFG